MPFNKLKFNNLLLSHKKTIEQSRIQVIGKLVHKIRKLRKLIEKQNSTENAKSSTKLRKSIIGLEYLKKCRRLELVTKVLLLEKPFSVLTNGSSKPEDIAIALICTNKIMIGLILTFHNELELSSPECLDWRNELEKFSTKKLKSQERKRIRLKKLARVGGKAKLGKTSNKKKKPSGTSKTPKAKTNGDEPNQTSSAKPRYTSVSEKSGTWTEQQIDVVVETPANEKKNLPKTQISEFDSRKKVQEEVHLKNTLELNGRKQDAKPKITTKPPKEEKETLVVDTFFFTESGDNYLSTAVPSAETSLDQQPIDNMDKFDDFPKVEKKFGAAHEKRRHSNEQHNVQPSRNPKRIKQTTVVASVKDRKFENAKNDVNAEASSNKEGLHPSWLAKQKLKPTITAFQGKKIVFDNDE